MESSPYEVEWIDLDGGRALLTSGEIVPIDSWFRHGERIEEPSDATHCVAGPDSDGWWYTITVHQDEQVLIQ